MIKVLFCFLCSYVFCDTSCIVKRFVQYMNNLQSLEASFVQKEGDAILSEGSIVWKRPFFVHLLTHFKGAPMLLVINDQGSFAFNKAYQSVTTLDTSHHALRYLFAESLLMKEVFFLEKVDMFYKLRVLKKGMWVDALCDAQGVLKGWVAQGAKQHTLLQKMKENVTTVPELFHTPKAPTPLERKEFWARHIACGT